MFETELNAKIHGVADDAVTEAARVSQRPLSKRNAGINILAVASLFTVCVLCSLTARAQTTASADAKTAIKETGTLTKEERGEAARYYEETRKKFLESVEGLSEQQWMFKSAPDRWSVAEVAEHIALTEQMLTGVVMEKIMKSPAAPEKMGETKGKEAIIMEKIPDRSTKAQAPEMLKPTGRWKTQAELVKDFQASRDTAINYIKTTQDDMRAHIYPHPVLKDLDAYQWMLFIAAHTARHTAQINEVKADPTFPKM